MENINNYNPIIITGPSGSGKSTIVNYIVDNNSLFIEAEGVTTREKRKNETDKIISISFDEFNRLIEKDLLIEYSKYNGNYYGIPKAEYVKLKEKYLLFNVGYSSAKIIKSNYVDSIMIFLLPPTRKDLVDRLGDRYNDYRYQSGKIETINNIANYDYLLISKNNDLAGTYRDFIDIVNKTKNSEKFKVKSLKNDMFIKSFYGE